MSQVKTLLPDTPETVQTASRVSSPLCPGCQAPLQGRQKVACSDKCRAVVWRQRREAVQAERDRRLRALLEEALVLIETEAE